METAARSCWQTAIRVYGDNAGVLNHYFTLTLVDRAGNASTVYGRMSVTFVKVGTRSARRCGMRRRRGGSCAGAG